MKFHKAIALALVGCASSPATAQATAAFAVMDVQVGMSLAQAKQVLTGKGYNVQTSTITIDWLDRPTFPVKLVANRADPTAHSSELIEVWLSYPPSQSTVVGIYRGVTYEPDKGPLATSFFDLARDKAGFEIYRHTANVYAGQPWLNEQLIRWAPDGKRVSGFGKLFSNLPQGTPMADPCVVNYHAGGRPLIGVDAPLQGVSFVTHTIRDKNGTGFFVPRPNCGTTFESLIIQDGEGLARDVGLLLVDQTRMFNNATDYRKWASDRDRADMDARHGLPPKAAL